jgi:hypothetical protein
MSGTRDYQRISSVGGITRPMVRAKVREMTAVAPPGDTPEKLRKSLGDGLRREGFSSLAEDRSRRLELFAGQIAKLVIAAGIALAISLQLDLGDVTTGTLAVAVYLTLELVSLPSRPTVRLYGLNLYLAAWVVAGGWEALDLQMMSLAVTHVLPVSLGIVAALILSEPGTLKRVGRTLLAAMRSVPLAFPVTMLILFAVMLTAEVWQAAHHQSNLRLLGLAAVAIVPQLLFLRSRLVKAIPDDFREVADELDKAGREHGAGAIAGMTIDRLRAVNGRGRVLWVDSDARKLLTGAYTGRSFRAEADRICEQVEKRMCAGISIRLMLTVLGVGGLVFVYVYLIVFLAVDQATAKRWIGVEQGTELGSWTFLPGAPYVNVALLLAVVAAAVFLAFVVTGSGLVKRLSGDYVHESAKTILLFAVASGAIEDPASAAGDEEEPEPPGRRRAPRPLPAPG